MNENENEIYFFTAHEPDEGFRLGLQVNLSGHIIALHSSEVFSDEISAMACARSIAGAFETVAAIEFHDPTAPTVRSKRRK